MFTGAYLADIAPAIYFMRCTLTFVVFRMHLHASFIFILHFLSHAPCRFPQCVRLSVVGGKDTFHRAASFSFPVRIQGLFPCLSMHICFHACPLLARGWCCGCQLHHPFVPILHILVFSVPWLEMENRSIFGFPFQRQWSGSISVKHPVQTTVRKGHERDTKGNTSRTTTCTTPPRCACLVDLRASLPRPSHVRMLV